MADAWVFTLPNPRMGPAATDLFRVKGVTEVVITQQRPLTRYKLAAKSLCLPKLPARYSKLAAGATNSLDAKAERLAERLLETA